MSAALSAKYSVIRLFSKENGKSSAVSKEKKSRLSIVGNRQIEEDYGTR